ncbi:hypothetical protein CO661_14150 [Sinorhizobium fredii]|uniref:Uncharacterized protein n=1 Tax=Rhizobium fredii TaxID=380 RepID=A0A2A6LYE6_RHIFR|nr:hypothetical protein [Sinorhizobium fredii]PDT47320.1 hypothetical protein CO661_14150 [Sinorhizobium fredii]
MAGNANSGRKQEKPFRDALRMELAAAGEDNKALRKIARALIEKAEAGDMQAIKELADRTDGKVPQALIGDEENPINLIHKIERVIVDAANPDRSGI